MLHVPIARFSSPLRASEPCIGQNKQEYRVTLESIRVAWEREIGVL